jgi:hypothetical protein
MKGYFADRWTVMHRWWSVRIGVVGVLLIAGMPALEDQIPELKQILLGWFPRNGAQWVPMLCILLTVLARVLSQAAVIEQLRRALGKKDGQQ